MTRNSGNATDAERDADPEERHADRAEHQRDAADEEAEHGDADGSPGCGGVAVVVRHASAPESGLLARGQSRGRSARSGHDPRRWPSRASRLPSACSSGVLRRRRTGRRSGCPSPASPRRTRRTAASERRRCRDGADQRCGVPGVKSTCRRPRCRGVPGRSRKESARVNQAATAVTSRPRAATQRQPGRRRGGPDRASRARPPSTPGRRGSSAAARGISPATGARGSGPMRTQLGCVAARTVDPRLRPGDGREHGAREAEQARPARTSGARSAIAASSSSSTSASKQVRSPVWQAAPTWSTLTRSVSPSQSRRTSRTCWT